MKIVLIDSDLVVDGFSIAPTLGWSDSGSMFYDFNQTGDRLDDKAVLRRSEPMPSPNLQHCTVSLLLLLYSQFRSITARHQESARVSEKQAQAARASTGSVRECS